MSRIRSPVLDSVLRFIIEQLRCFVLRFINSHSDATGIFAMHFWEIIALTTSGNRVRPIVSLKMTPLPGYWDADHGRPRTMNTVFIVLNY